MKPHAARPERRLFPSPAAIAAVGAIRAAEARGAQKQAQAQAEQQPQHITSSERKANDGNA